MNTFVPSPPATTPPVLAHQVPIIIPADFGWWVGTPMTVSWAPVIAWSLSQVGPPIPITPWGPNTHEAPWYSHGDRIWPLLKTRRAQS